MAFVVFSRLKILSSGSFLRLNPASSASSYPSAGVRVIHDRENCRFTASMGSEAGNQDCAVLRYTFTSEKQVDLISTNVPVSFRGKGVAALLSKTAMEFLAEENLKAHISCWYIKKYINDNPMNGYEEHIIN